MAHILLNEEEYSYTTPTIESNPIRLSDDSDAEEIERHANEDRARDVRYSAALSDYTKEMKTYKLNK